MEVEPSFRPYQGRVLPLYEQSKLEHRKGIEPLRPRYEGGIIPLDHQCKLGATYRNRNGAYSLARNRSATIPTSPRKLERSIGLEPIRRVWKTPMLPLHQHRSKMVAGVRDDLTEACL
jgi:hypothetical protein